MENKGGFCSASKIVISCSVGKKKGELKEIGELCLRSKNYSWTYHRITVEGDKIIPPYNVSFLKKKYYS